MDVLSWNNAEHEDHLIAKDLLTLSWVKVVLNGVSTAPDAEISGMQSKELGLPSPETYCLSHTHPEGIVLTINVA